MENVSEKIKTLSMVVCVINVLACVIIGIFLITDGAFLYGLIIGAVGVLSSLLSAFVIYGVGQIVENTDTIVNQNRRILAATAEAAPRTYPAAGSAAAPGAATSSHTWRCPSCGDTISSYPCPRCNYDARQQTDDAAPYHCGKCGNSGPFEGNCPVCGSSVRVYR